MFSPGNFKRNWLRFAGKIKSKRGKIKTRNASQKRRGKSLMKRRYFGLDLKPQPKKKRKGKGKSIAQFAVENAADIVVDKNTGRVKFSKELSKKMGLKVKADGKQAKD